jgi:signal transduction histidine kinase/CheY-like chemotaxis protein
MRKYIPRATPRYIAKVALFFCVYVVMAKLGLAVYSFHGAVTFFWLPTGISLAVLILYGYDMWPAITLGSLAAMLLSGVSPGAALGIAAGNTLEAIIGTYLLRRYIILFRCFERLEDTIGFIGLGALGASTISATIGALSLWAAHIIGPGEFSTTWVIWWIGNVLSSLVITPFLLTSLAPSRPWNADGLSRVEIYSFGVILLATNFIIFWKSFAPIGNLPSFYLFISLPLLWGCLRLGSRGITISIFVTWLIATLSTASGHGPFSDKTLFDAMLLLQVFIGTLSITFLVFLSIVKERKHAVAGLKDHIAKLENAVHQISSADQAKNDFLATLAHELRNPLAPLRSSLELLQIRTQENSDLGKLTDAMHNHVRTMARLLDDLLDISRITRKKITLEKELVHMQSIIEQSAEMAEPHIRKHRHQLTISMPESALWVFGDPIRIEQMIVNILNNAAKYTDPGGKIYLSCTGDAAQVHVSVRDTGLGIEPDMIGRIFEPFLQIDSKRTHTSGGLGIGLHLTKTLAELHEGTIEARSEGLGRGSEFVISLPRTDAALSDRTPEAVAIPASSLASAFPAGGTGDNRKYTVLVVDDNEAAATGLAELLRYKGHTVGLAYDGFSALETVQKFSPQIIIVDIGMPVMDGYEVARKLKERSDSPFTLIALTGYGQDEDKAKARVAGFDYHLTKPISIMDIEKIFGEL